jgi:RNA recognition motif-containing protein
MSDSDEVMGVDLEGGAYKEMDTETEERLLRESPDLNGKNDGEANGEVKVSCLELLKSDEWIHLDDPFKDVDDNLKVCAGNIPPEVGEDQLKFHFSTCYGPVMDVHLRSDSDGTGFAFIIFEEAKIAEKVMTNKRHYKINDMEMYIKSYARESYLELLKRNEMINLDDPYKELDDNLKVCIGNILPEVGEDQLKSHFSTSYGPVKDVNLRSDSDGTGFAFVVFEDATIAKTVYSKKEHYKICGKEMVIKSYTIAEEDRQVPRSRRPC